MFPTRCYSGWHKWRVMFPNSVGVHSCSSQVSETYSSNAFLTPFLKFSSCFFRNSTIFHRLCSRCGRHNRPARNASGLSSGEILIEIPQEIESSSLGEVTSSPHVADLGPTCILQFDEVHEVLETPSQSQRSSPQLFEVSRPSSPEAPYAPWLYKTKDDRNKVSVILCEQEVQRQPSEPASFQPI